LLRFIMVGRREQQSRDTSTIDVVGKRSRPHVLFGCFLEELHKLHISKRA
jgi:hypothetical protein